MKIRINLLKCIAIIAMLFALTAQAQRPRAAASGSKRTAANDSTNRTPRGLKTWTIDERFGSVTPTVPDTMQHLFQNTNFSDGLRGGYNHTGNLSAPRTSRIYNGQQDYMMGSQFIFTRPYDMALSSVNDCVFTNTKSPITNLTWFTQGNKQTGSDRLRVNFASNVNKDAGIGFKVDYLYGRGYYTHQHHSSVAAKIFGSYRGERYQMHAAYILDRTKNAENGGLTDENYIEHPEYYSTKYSPADMPVRLQYAYNGMNLNTLFLTHRYNLGYYAVRDTLGNLHTVRNPHAKVKEPAAAKPSVTLLTAIKDSIFAQNDSILKALPDTMRQTATDSLMHRVEMLAEKQMKLAAAAEKADEADTDTLNIKGTTLFVPVAAFVHTAKFDHNTRGFYDYNRDRGFYIDNFFPENDSIQDRTRYLSVENTLALEMSEGFKKWVKTGMRLFAKHQLTRFALPDETYTLRGETFNYITLGAQLMKEQGSVFHYNVLGELRTTGVDWGEFNVEGNVRFDIPIRHDSISVRADGFVRNEEPAYYFRHYHSNTAWWDNDLSKVFRSRLQGTLGWRKTRLKVAFETIQNHTFFQEIVAPANGTEYALATARYGINVAQADKNVQVLSATLCQDFKFGPLMWENEVTYQTSSNQDVLPLPTVNVWSNLYLHFKIAKVLSTDLGADVRYFTKYYAPAYSPMMGLYAVQDAETREKVGNYPWVNVYANFHLKQCRFFVMFSHVNSAAGRPFLVPHYPTDRRCLRIGISWNFFN